VRDIDGATRDQVYAIAKNSVFRFDTGSSGGNNPALDLADR